MSVVLASVIYLVVGIALTAAVGRALGHSGRAFLLGVFGDDGASADAVTRLLVVGFYLLSLGFVALTMGMPAAVGNAGQALRVLSVKVGELLLVLGVAHFANLVVFGGLSRARARASGRVVDAPAAQPVWRPSPRKAAR